MQINNFIAFFCLWVDLKVIFHCALSSDFPPGWSGWNTILEGNERLQGLAPLLSMIKALISAIFYVKIEKRDNNVIDIIQPCNFREKNLSCSIFHLQ